MTQRPEWETQVDEKGRLVVPPEIASRCGLNPGVRVHMGEGENGLRLRRPVSHLAKVYVEPTNGCNLECRTCIRNGWDEPLGQMSDAIFTRIIDGLRAFSPPPTVFFGGFGEPLAHPRIVEMVSRAKALGGPVEMVTNGTLLTQDTSRGLIAAGLDMLWVSIDGATPESYADVRLGAALAELDLAADFDRIQDIREFAKYGIRGAPALVINGKVKAAGRVPPRGEIKKWLQEGQNER